MKKAGMLVLGAALLAVGAWTPVAKAATEAEKLAAIQAGLAHLASIQNQDGSLTASGYKDGPTGAALYAFLSQKANWPAASVAQYQTVVTNMVNYLLGAATLVPSLSTRSDNVNICPGGSGTCKGVYWNGQGEQTYSTGLVDPGIVTYGLMQGAGAVATNSGPLAGMTWAQIAQGVTNTFSAAQSTNGQTKGGWRYSLPANSDADTSTTQWAVISFIFDEALGATTPQPVKSLLQNWLAAAISSNGGTGAACYDYSGDYCDHSDTGGWELAMTYLGNNLNSAQQAGINFLNTNWKAGPSNTWFGNFGHPYAMWSVYKGLDTTIGLKDNTHILNLKTDCGASTNDPPGSGVCNWWEDYNHFLVKSQNQNGSWTDTAGYWPDPINTSFFVSILGAAAVPTGTNNPQQPSAVPVLSKWGLVSLAILLAGFAAVALRRPRTA